MIGLTGKSSQRVRMIELSAQFRRRGKVVLIDFWAYSCINCQRAIPHVVDWYNRYRDDGFVAIGVHPGKKPLFSTEERLDMVRVLKARD